MILKATPKIPDHALVEEEIGFLTIVVVATCVFLLLLVIRFVLRKKSK